MSIVKTLIGFFTGKHSTGDINFAELIILAALGKKLNSGRSAKENLALAPECVFGSVSQEKADLSINKFKNILKESTDKSLPLKEEEIRDSFELLTSGRAESDVKDTLLNLLKSIPRFPSQVLTDIPNIFRNPTDLPGLPGFDVASKTAVSIIRPDKRDPRKNRIFRLAILAYARMNGVNIEEKNLMDLSDFLESGEESDFTKLVENGLETMKDQYGVTDIQTAAKKLHSISQACMNKAR